MSDTHQRCEYKIVPSRPPEKALEQARCAYRNASVYDVDQVWWRIWHDCDYIEPPLVTARVDLTPKQAVDVTWALADALVGANLDRAINLQIIGTAPDPVPQPTVECPKELVERINANVEVMSVLYDVNLLPEQVDTVTDFCRMIAIVELVERIQRLERNPNVG